VERSVARREILPFALLLASLIVATLIIDALLHHFDLVWVGRYLGIPGTLLILSSFLYSLRKRKRISVGKPRVLLALHETLTLLGALMILVHAGVHVYTILPWLALTAMLVNVISGMTGKFLLDRSRRHLADKKAIYAQRGVESEVLDRELFWDAVAVDAMKQWRAVHFPITLVFAVLSVAHILGIFLFWQWK